MTMTVTGKGGGEQEGGQVSEREQMWLMLTTGAKGTGVIAVLFTKKIFFLNF